MLVKVQECRGPTGERLRRSEWSEAVVGRLSIHNARDHYCATLTRLDVSRLHDVLSPLFDVRVKTLDEGFLVIGFRVAAEDEGRVVREVRQAWYCVPAEAAQPSETR